MHPVVFVIFLNFLKLLTERSAVISFFVFLAYPLIIAKRIKNEEALLEKELEGYREYKQKVKYKLIPYIW